MSRETILKADAPHRFLHNLWKYLLIAASLVATVKIIFFGFDIVKIIQ